MLERMKQYFCKIIVIILRKTFIVSRFSSVPKNQKVALESHQFKFLIKGLSSRKYIKWNSPVIMLQYVQVSDCRVLSCSIFMKHVRFVESPTLIAVFYLVSNFTPFFYRYMNFCCIFIRSEVSVKIDTSTEIGIIYIRQVVWVIMVSRSSYRWKAPDSSHTFH